MYTRRNCLESSTQHWMVLLGAVVAFLLALKDADAVVEQSQSLMVVGALALLAVATTGLAVRAWKRGETLEQTMRWESATTFVSILLVIGFIAVSGGLASPTVFVLLLWAPYLGMSVSPWYTGSTLLLMLVGVFAAGWYSETLNDYWSMAGIFAAVAAALVGVTYWYASDLYSERFSAEEVEAAVAERVELLSIVLAQAADGNLSVAVPDLEHGQANAAHAEHLDALAESLGRTVGSLRGLVLRVRVGGESIGSAASQVLVAAREQAVSASQQSFGGVGDDGDD